MRLQMMQLTLFGGDILSCELAFLEADISGIKILEVQKINEDMSDGSVLVEVKALIPDSCPPLLRPYSDSTPLSVTKVRLYAECLTSQYPELLHLDASDFVNVDRMNNTWFASVRA